MNDSEIFSGSQVNSTPSAPSNSSETSSQSVPGNSNPILVTTETLSALLTNSSRDLIMGQHNLSLVESIKTIPIFTGEDPFYSFANFKEKLQINASFFKWSEEVKFYAIQQRLAGKAQQTFDYYKHQLKTYNDVVKVLQDRFSPRKHPSDIMSSFWSFTQPSSMNVSEYLAQARLKVREITSLQNFSQEVRESTEEGWLLAMLLKNINP